MPHPIQTDRILIEQLERVTPRARDAVTKCERLRAELVEAEMDRTAIWHEHAVLTEALGALGQEVPTELVLEHAREVDPSA